MNKEKTQKVIFDLAFNTARKSVAKKQKCGAVLVRNSEIIATGYNQMFSGWDSSCEFDRNPPLGEYESYPEVCHAEMDCFKNCVKEGKHTPFGCDMFITHAPCMNCAKSIVCMGIKNVYVWNWSLCGVEDTNIYKGGLDFLRKYCQKNEQLENIELLFYEDVCLDFCLPFLPYKKIAGFEF